MGTVMDEYVRLGGVPLPSGFRRESSFSAAVRDARAVSGRDPTAGHVIDEVATGRWMGGVAWLCLFDQIGTAVGLTGTPPVKHAGGRFRGCLEAFSGVTAHERDVLWALRNSLAHDYSLWHVEGEGTQPEFALTRDAEKGLMWVDPSRPARTIVNLRALGGLGNDVVKAVIAAHVHGQLVLHRPESEMKRRYFLEYASGPVTVGRLDTTSTAVTGLPGPRQAH